MRITGIATGREGGDAIAFLQDMLPKWIPSLSNAKIQIDHRIRSNKNNGQATMIFKVFRYQDGNGILQGAREARKNAPIQDTGRTIRFYADYSAFTSEMMKVYGEVMKELYERGIPAFLIYPATLRMTINGEQCTFTSAREAAQFLRKEASEGPPSRTPPAVRHWLGGFVTTRGGRHGVVWHLGSTWMRLGSISWLVRITRRTLVGDR